MRTLFFVVTVAAALAAEEVVETNAAGVVVERYETDDQGKKHGTYLAYYDDGTVRIKCGYHHGVLQGKHNTYRENGKVAVGAYYRKGELSGPYRTYHGNGRPHVVTAYKEGGRNGKYTEKDPAGAVLVEATYRTGALHGKRVIYRDKRAISVQLWKAGRLLRLNGTVAYARPLDEIRATLASLLGEEALSDEPANHLRRHRDEELAKRAEPDRVATALARLKAYRYLCEVPWSDLELDEKYNRGSTAAARVCRRNGEISHTPKDPGGLAPDEYKLGYEGAQNSNLAQGPPVEFSVDGYFDDSDERNLSRLGHRAWSLNPKMLRTGFGYDGIFSAMWATDAGRTEVPAFEIVTFPARGYMPVGFFGPHYAWSVFFNPEVFRAPEPGKASARIYPLDGNHVAAKQPLGVNYTNVLTNARGIPYLLIFRPRKLDMSAGRRYWVEVTGVERKKPDPKRRKVTFLVEFASLAKR